MAGSVQTINMQTKLQYLRITSSDKDFINKLATQWLAGYLDAQRATSVFGHGVLQMASGLDRHQADYNIGFAWYAKQIISQTYRSHFISAYLCPFKKNMVL